MEQLTKDQRKALRQEEWKKELQKEEGKKRISKILWWAGAAALLAFSVWFLFMVVNSSSSPSTTATTIAVPKVTDADMTAGPKDAKVVMVEYADFQCPGCGAAYPTLKKLQDQYKDKMLFVYRFFPLEQIHRNAIASAMAAYASSKQGKFWEMHDQLFANQQKWAEESNPTPLFDSYARAIGLDMDKYHKDLQDPATEKFVKDSEQKAGDIGVNSTPTIFINGKQITGFNPLSGYDNLKKIIDTELAKK